MKKKLIKELKVSKEQKREFRKGAFKILLTGILIIIILTLSQILKLYDLRDLMIAIGIIWAFFVTKLYHKILYKGKNTRKFAEFLIEEDKKTFPKLMIIAVILIMIYFFFISLVIFSPYFKSFRFLTEEWMIGLITILIIVVPVLISFILFLYKEKKKFGVIYR